ncbi:hypothetical protein OSB04_012161 [Centaurea solstitialis]|uniref:CCHC-type domain-containing protein n=1 Tax=Centaurea solstitialis TaxID=347529 RepID=A0AA38TTY5_9ASTR|nr:hypothetical protein OSB04_012161 [Centaurea solstitialis]
MEETTSSEEVLVCQTCGDKGYTNAFVYCVKCLGYVIHRYTPFLPIFLDLYGSLSYRPTFIFLLLLLRYCLHVVTYDEFVPWYCEDCNPTVSYQFALPRLESSGSQKEHPTSSENVKTKKRKTVPSVAGKDVVSCQEEAIEPDHECVSPASCPLKEASEKSDSGCNQITPCVVSRFKKGDCQNQASEPAHLDDCSSPKESAKRNGDATSLAVKTEKEHSAEPSVCDSICTNLTSKDKEGMIRSVEEQRCEIQQSQTDHDKLVSDSSSVELTDKTRDYDGQTGTANQMQHVQQETSASKAGADAYTSAPDENNLQYVHFLPAKPVLDPVWRGSFRITETDYDLFEGFVGHLSTKACYKVCNEATMLPSLLTLEMQPKTALWPKSFVDSQPTDEHIALYFFPGDAKNERAFERLVINMIDEELAMRATAKNAELLIFPSTLLPQSHWRFQGNHYLWGVFRAKLQASSSSHVNKDLAVSNNSVDRDLPRSCLNEVTSGEKIRASVKPFGSRSPQSPLCNYRLPMAQNNTIQNPIRSILLKEKLNNTNFVNWYCALRIVLRAEAKLYVLEQPIPEEPNTNSSMIEWDAFKKHEEDACDVSCLMLISMEPELQKQHENMVPFDMIEHLKLLFKGQVRYERYEISKKLFDCKLAEGSPVGPHVVEMMRYMDQLKRLGFPLRNELAIDFVLQSLPNSYNQFVMNYKMQGFKRSFVELLNMLQTTEKELLTNKFVIPMVPLDQTMKGKGKYIAKSAFKALRPKGAIKKKPKRNAPNDDECFRCNMRGHWKRHCPLYLEESRKGRMIRYPCYRS